MPRSRIVETSKALAELVGGNEDCLCIITEDALENILQENANIHHKLHDVQKSISESNVSISRSLDMLVKTASHIHTKSQEHSDALLNKLDGLIETVKSKPTLTASTPEINIESQLKYRKDLTSKIIRADRLSAYYEEQLSETPAFVRHEFRTKVNKNATESSLVHRRKQTTDNVTVEINIMRDNIKNWTEKKQKIEEKLEEFLAQNEDQRTELSDKIIKQETQCKDEFEKGFIKIKKTDEEEKFELSDYLIETDEDKDASSKNFRGRGSNRGRRRGRGYPRY